MRSCGGRFGAKIEVRRHSSSGFCCAFLERTGLEVASVAQSDGGGASPVSFCRRVVTDDIGADKCGSFESADEHCHPAASLSSDPKIGRQWANDLICLFALGGLLAGH
jgi:hypothetical protein